LDRRLAGSEDRSCIENADRARGIDLDAEHALNNTGIGDTAAETRRKNTNAGGTKSRNRARVSEAADESESID